MLHKGDYSEQFLPCDIVLLLGFTECGSSKSPRTPDHRHSAATEPQSRCHQCQEKRFVKIREDEHCCRYQFAEMQHHICQSTWMFGHVQSAGRGVS